MHEHDDDRPELFAGVGRSARPALPRTLLRLALTVIVAGALVAGLLLPWVGGPAVAAQQGTSLLGDPPAVLTDGQPAGNSVVLAADGTPITYFYDENRQPVGSDDVATVMKDALVAIEDARFYQHNGLDVQGTTRALVRNVVAGAVEEGGSTLTQQLVKQTLLQTAESAEAGRAAVERSVARKLREARLALALEDLYSKDELLTRYLNIVYFGRNAYGIQAAARAFFGVDAADLTLPQAALLAGVIQSPSDHDPFTEPDSATARRNLVLDRMAAEGYVTPAEAAAAQAAPLGLDPGPAPRRGCVQALVGAYVCDFVQQYLTQDLGISQDELDSGGYTIRTTLDVALQKSGDRAVLQTLDMGQSLAGMFTAVEPGTGHLLAMSINRRFGVDRSDPAQESYNLFRHPARGAGSTYKVFVAAAALARGYSTGYTLTTSDPYTSRVYAGECPGGTYCVRNAGGYRSTLDMTTALYQSSNTYFLALEDALGSVDEPVQMAEDMGLYQFGPDGVAERTAEEERGSFAFGPDATSPLGLASAYSTLAAGGTQCDVVPVTEILDSHGDPVLGDDGTPLAGRDRCTEEAIPPGVANTLNQMLRRDVEPGYGGQTGWRAYVPGHQIAGKTGTTQENLSVAFVGYTPEITASVMVLNPREKEDVGGFGGGKGATIWHDAMAPILQARGSSDFPPADPEVERGNTVAVPWCYGVDGCQAALASAGFEVLVSHVDSSEAAGTVVGTSPSRGGRAVRGQVVTVLVSNGSSYVAPAPRAPSAPTSDTPPTEKPTPKPKPKPEPDPKPEPKPDPKPEPDSPPPPDEKPPPPPDEEPPPPPEEEPPPPDAVTRLPG
jgi:membrane peptidoglycan carboxypeptidase